MMYKRVNIYPTSPIFELNPPIRTVTRDVIKSVTDIRKCILANAYVEQILNDGSLVKLTINNYDKDLDVKPGSTSTSKPSFSIGSRPKKSVVIEGPTKPAGDTKPVEPIVEEPESTVTTETTSVSHKSNKSHSKKQKNA